MAKVRFYPIDITYITEKNKAKILIFGRTDAGKQICVKDDFQPYFYIIPDDNYNPNNVKRTIEKNNLKYEITNMEKMDMNYLGDKTSCYKIEVSHPSSVPLFREELKRDQDIKLVLEADILFTRRYMIDKKIRMLTLYEVKGEEEASNYKVPLMKAKSIQQINTDPIKEPRILAVDIETYNPDGEYSIPEKDPIVMLAVYGKDYKKIVTWKRFKTKEDIEFVNSEPDLLEKFQEYVEEYKPDFITGYFSDRFDLPFIKKRADKYKLKLDLGLNNSKMSISKGGFSNVSIAGISHIDIYQFIFNTMRVALKTDTYDLSSVSAELLGEKKNDVDIAALGAIWDNDPDKLEKYCLYNLQDSKMTYLLCEKLFPNIIEMTNMIGLSPYDVTRMSYSTLVEWFLINHAKEKNILAPNRPNREETNSRMNREPFKGAMVLEPKPGLYNDIAVFDFRSLYPSIIASHNLGPDTLNCDCCFDKVPGLDFHFCQKKKGFIASVISEIIERRMRIKEILRKTPDEILDARQGTLKILLNSFYGYFGYYGSRWYSPESGESTTAYGRYYIQMVVDKAKEIGFDVIYGDTDSLFLKLGEKKKQDALNFANNINSKLPGIMELEYEDFFKSGIFVFTKQGGGAKKKYALMDENGKIKVRGFALVRRDWSETAKRTQKEVLEIILGENDGKKAFEHARNIIQKIKRHEIPIKDMVISTQLTKKIDNYEQYGPHVAVATRMKARGLTVGPGSMIRYVIIKGKEKIRDRARLVDEVKQDDYDPTYYINNQVIPAVEQVLHIVGFLRDDLLEDKDQSKLGSFF